MPWHIENDNPECSGFAVVKDADSEIEGCHKTKADAMKQMAALYADEEASMADTTSPPRDNLVRAMSAGYEVRDGNTLLGHFARFNEWTLIDSAYEGRFMERIAPGAFRKTLSDKANTLRILFQHGKDPTIGDKPIAVPTVMREDEEGAYYEADLLDGIPALVLDGLRRGQYGSSFRFRVRVEDFKRSVKPSIRNPEGLPERTVREAEVFEFGPVTFPAYVGATATLRSMTDEFVLDTLSADPARLREMVANIEPAAPDAGTEAQPHPVAGRITPVVAPPTTERKAIMSNHVLPEERAARITELKAVISRQAIEFPGVMPDTEQATYDADNAELDELLRDDAAWNIRQARLATFAAKPGNVEPVYEPIASFVRKTTEDIFDPAVQEPFRYRSTEQWGAAQRDNAMRAAEQAVYPQPNVNADSARAGLQVMLDTIDSPDRQLARRMLAVGSPIYRRAFNKLAASQPLTTEEQRAASLAVTTDTTGGFALPFAFDPSLIHTGAWTYINGIRANATVKQIVGTDTWRGVSVNAVSAIRGDESTEQAEQGPTFAQPEILASRVSAFVSYSIEMGMDRPDLGSELASLIAEAKDTEEESEFTLGVGATHHSIGIMPDSTTAGMYGHVHLTTDHTLVAADAYLVEAALGLRHRKNAVWFMGRAMIRSWQAVENAFGQLFGGLNYASVGYPQNSAVGATGLELLRYPIIEAPSAVTAFAGAGDDLHVISLLVNPKTYYIVDRVGMNVEFIPHLWHADGKLPIGVRGLYAYWRNGAEPVDTAGGVTLWSTAA